MPAGLFDEAEGGPTQPPNGGNATLDTPGSFVSPEQKASQMRDVFAQIMAAQQGISPPPGPQLQDENLWAAQGQAQLGAPPQGPQQFNTPPGPTPGMTVPSMQAQPPQPGMNFPTAPAGPGAPGGMPPLPPEIGAFPGNKGLTTGGEGGGGPGGGAYGLPPTLGRRALR